MYKYFKSRNFEWGNLMLFFSRDLSVDEKNVYMEALAFILNVGKSNNDAKKEYMETQMAEIGLRRGTPDRSPADLPRLRQGQTAPHRPHLLPLRRTAALPAARQHGIRRAVSLGPLPDRLHIPLLTGRQCIHDKNRRNRFVRFLRFFIPDDARRKLSRSVQYRRAANTHAHRTIRRPPFQPTDRPANRP